MIGKSLSMKDAQKSSFARLVRYLCDKQKKQVRVGKVTISNCHSLDREAAVLEVLNMQAMNTTAESDKTYHLFVSFRAGEIPDSVTLRAVENRICEALGFGEHQRISVVHHDTNNLHIHIAINKVHPTKYSVHTPFNDFYTIGRICERLEIEYGLERDNHQGQKRGSENRAEDMEHHTGIETLVAWIGRECLDKLQKATTWEQLHHECRRNGLTLKERGNGLIVVSDSGVIAKASTVSRDLAMSKLEARLGKFVSLDAAAANIKPERQYEGRPKQTRFDTSGLFLRYQKDRQTISTVKKASLAKKRGAADRQIEAAKRSWRLRRNAIRLMSGEGVNRKLLYALAIKSLKDQIQEISRQWAKERKDIHEANKRLAWVDWLRKRAGEGDQEALSALRARSASGLKGNGFSGTKKTKNPKPDLAQKDSVTKTGTVIYLVGETAVRDDGHKLNVSTGASHEGIEAALHMAQDRFGSQLVVEGSELFKEQVVWTAVNTGLDISFENAELEQRRQILLKKTTTNGGTRGEEKTDGQRENQRSSGGDGAGGSAGNGRRRGRTVRVKKPSTGRIGQDPPPEGQNGLRELSLRNLAKDAQGFEVLLPSDVHPLMEHGRSKPDFGVRRGVSGRVGQGDPAGIAAATAAVNKYIAERNQKRLEIFDIPKHLPFRGEDSGTASFAGIRRIDGVTMAVLKRGENNFVLPVDAPTEARLKKRSIGEEVVVLPSGAVEGKGRGRGR
ncbi:MAG: relaxase/mobilization nuclease domain-containing protein [Alphaproteobacteria bacterium]|nr:relaxase/mobilization nuclease domain-containing protein [Alphaproteobacteria bacterium]